MQILKRLYNAPVTLSLIVVNTIVFCMMAIKGHEIWWGDADDLLQWGANYWPLTSQQHQYWRLLTSMFLHAGLWHLFTNMLGLLIAGIFLEPILKGPKFCIVYLVTGLVADYASIWFHPDAVGVGASGAIFGIYGAFLALLTTPLFKRSAKMPFLIFIALFVGLNIIVACFTVGIDNIAHLTGFGCGILTGYLLYFTLSKTDAGRLSN
ncbi:rhomboid family intramembrane serine protease [Chitinophaga sp. sic0106]|uniref:rhomboid family intramembrane serine protease n=1 Tax=Chitinophaga sp. sic0106 TaxID=2854785 RepID=UPI001C454E04|nr:rhomboid family intramembrane serine protease [Chitinophaga sp. sic0106]MBV7533313.1 rhomboid family intramembrane serine protease [Chitinophaga sp. sic0106]